MSNRIHSVLIATALAAVALSTFVGLGAQAHAAAGYRYWAYFLGTGTGWQYAQRGPATDYPDDGTVQGWRFAIASDAATVAPRPTPDFALLCATTASEPGRIRVGVVLDFGLASDAPAGDHPPAAPVTGCVSVPDGSSGIVVLDDAVGSGGVRIGTGADVGLVCGIAGYPATECAVTVTAPTTRPSTPQPRDPKPSTPRTSTPQPSLTLSTKPSSTPHPRQIPSAAEPVADPSATPTASNVSSASASIPASSPTVSPPSSASVAAAPSSSSAAPLLLSSTTLRTHRSNRFPVSAVVGATIIVLLGAAAVARLRRRGAP